MKSTRAIPANVHRFSDMTLVAMSFTDVMNECDLLKNRLFGDAVYEYVSPMDNEGQIRLSSWLMHFFPHHIGAAEPEVLDVDLNPGDVQALLYRLIHLPRYLDAFAREVDVASGCALPAPAGDSVLLVPAHCGLRLCELLVYRHLHFACCWSAVFDD